jgi:hypothetical protein
MALLSGIVALVVCGSDDAPLPTRDAADSPTASFAPPEPGRQFHFVDVAPELGVTRVVHSGRPNKDHLLDSIGNGVAFLDYNRDGRLDVYVVNSWRMEGNRITERGRNALYRQEADGRFTDVTDEAGADGAGHWGGGAYAADVDDDGWIDLFVTNFGPNLLYRSERRPGVAGVEHGRGVLRRRGGRRSGRLRGQVHRDER